MNIVAHVKRNLKKFIPSALKKRYGMSRRRRHGHRR